MSRRIKLRPAARRDLHSTVEYLRATAGADAAARFVDAARHDLSAIAETPALGSPVQTRSVRLAGLRKWRIDGSLNIRIFYLWPGDEIIVLRIVHAASDWQAYFDAD